MCAYELYAACIYGMTDKKRYLRIQNNPDLSVYLHNYEIQLKMRKSVFVPNRCHKIALLHTVEAELNCS